MGEEVIERLMVTVPGGLTAFGVPWRVGHVRMTGGWRLDGAKRPDQPSRGVFQYTVSGKGMVWYRGKAYPVPPGSGLLLWSHDPQAGYGHASAAAEPWESYFVAILGVEEAIKEVIRRWGPVFRVDPQGALVADITAVLAQRREVLSPEAALRLVTGVFACAASAAGHSERHAPVTRRAVTFIHQHRCEPITVEDVARRAGVSAIHLARCFRRDLDQTPKAFITATKVERACNLLRESTLSIKEIAAKLGYGGSSQFCRVFRAAVGIAPGGYRRDKAP